MREREREKRTNISNQWTLVSLSLSLSHRNDSLFIFLDRQFHNEFSVNNGCHRWTKRASVDRQTVSNWPLSIVLRLFAWALFSFILIAIFFIHFFSVLLFLLSYRNCPREKQSSLQFEYCVHWSSIKLKINPVLTDTDYWSWNSVSLSFFSNTQNVPERNKTKNATQDTKIESSLDFAWERERERKSNDRLNIGILWVWPL